MVNMIEDKESLLYYESHVTIEPVFDDQRMRVSVLAQRHQFRLAELLMKKREEDTEVRSKNDTFMTGHGKSLIDIQQRMKGLIEDLQRENFKVWRYKIEDTIMDSRTHDVLNLGVGK